MKYNNVDKIKEDVPSSAKLIAVVGSQALDGTSSDDIILNDEQTVKNNISDSGAENSKNKLDFYIPRGANTISNTRNISRDSEGHKLTDGQQEYFRNSKARD